LAKEDEFQIWMQNGSSANEKKIECREGAIQTEMGQQLKAVQGEQPHNLVIRRRCIGG
jgi:hypothetical protein